MAKVIGPLFSQEARGQFGKSVVFTRRRGQNIARGYAIPSNPQTPGQIVVRTGLAVTGLINKRVRATDWTYAGETETWIQFLTSRVTTGEVWNSAFGRLMLGPGLANFNAAVIQYEALAADITLLWETAATTAVTGLIAYTRALVTHSPGFQLFLAEQAIAAAGYGEIFDPEVPVEVLASVS